MYGSAALVNTKGIRLRQYEVQVTHAVEVLEVVEAWLAALHAAVRSDEEGAAVARVAPRPPMPCADELEPHGVPRLLARHLADREDAVPSPIHDRQQLAEEAALAQPYRYALPRPAAAPRYGMYTLSGLVYLTSTHDGWTRTRGYFCWLLPSFRVIHSLFALGGLDQDLVGVGVVVVELGRRVHVRQPQVGGPAPPR